MLALLERSVTDLGDSSAMGDTDSMAIVATEDGGQVLCSGGQQTLGRKEAIRALWWVEVGGIRQRFVQLNPYDLGKTGGSVRRIEDDNLPTDGEQRQLWCYAISAKRYCLYTLDDEGEPELAKWSEHGLGHLRNPTDPDNEGQNWMRQIWEGIVREALGLPHEEPGWLDRPALSRLTISSPELLDPFDDLNAGKAWPDQIKPFNFLLVGHVRPFGHPVGVDPSRFQPVAPYEVDSAKWRELPWIDRYSGQRYRVGSAGERDDPEAMRLQTYRDVVREFRTHPEVKSVGADGAVCTRQTVGLLQRRVLQETYVAHVGKEANRLEEVEAGLEHDPEVLYTEYQHSARDPWRTQVLPVLRRLPQQEVAEAVGLSVRRLRDLLSGRAQPRQQMKMALTRIAATAGEDSR